MAKAAAKKKTAPKPETMKGAVSKALNKGFDLNDFKKSKNLNSNAGFKPQEWLKVSDAFIEAVGLPGIAIGHLTVIRGHPDTGKSTLLLEASAASQRQGRLPVFIVTEQKWDFEHAKKIGLDIQEVVDTDTGEITYTGNFIYIDLESITTIEHVAAFILDILDEQAKGKLPYGIDFYWDSAGTIPCQQSIDSKTFNNEWAASAISRNFGNYIDQRITLSRKNSSPYTNSLIIVNKIWVDKPAVYGAQPVMKNKGGNTFYSDCSMLITFGNVTNSGTSKIKAKKDGKEVEFGKRVKVQVEKNHINGITTSTKIIATPHGFIKENPTDIEKYKKVHREEWLNVLGTEDFDLVEDDEIPEDTRFGESMDDD